MLLCNFPSRRTIIKSLRLLFENDPNNISGIEFYKTDSVKFIFNQYPKKAWCIDGEKLDRATKVYDFKTVNDFKVQMPTKNTKKLFLKRTNLDD